MNNTNLTDKELELVRAAVRTYIEEHPCKLAPEERAWVHAGSESVPIKSIQAIGLVLKPLNIAVTTFLVSIILVILFIMTKLALIHLEKGG